MFCFSRSYGAVHKAVHKKSGQILAVKKVPVDTDLQEIIKEISIMQQCDSQYVVKYYGSYFKNADLWVYRNVLFLTVLLNRLLWNIVVPDQYQT
jgi:serine/threonine protein kinase